jgi:hypothetical protein
VGPDLQWQFLGRVLHGQSQSIASVRRGRARHGGEPEHWLDLGSERVSEEPEGKVQLAADCVPLHGDVGLESLNSESFCIRPSRPGLVLPWVRTRSSKLSLLQVQDTPLGSLVAGSF